MNNQATSRGEESALLTGLFRSREDAERAYESLRARGYSDREINVMMSDQTRDKYYKDNPNTEVGSKALEGAGVGGTIGGAIGAIVGGIAAIGTNILLPGLGLIVAGPLAAACRSGCGRIRRRLGRSTDRLGDTRGTCKSL
jgi:Uncharacterized protein conserved in bacteria